MKRKSLASLFFIICIRVLSASESESNSIEGNSNDKPRQERPNNTAVELIGKPEGECYTRSHAEIHNVYHPINIHKGKGATTAGKPLKPHPGKKPNAASNLFPPSSFISTVVWDVIFGLGAIFLV